MHHPAAQEQRENRTPGAQQSAAAAVKAILTLALLAVTPAAAVAQATLASGTGQSATAVATEVSGPTTTINVPSLRTGRYGPGGRTRFAEGTGYFRPYTLSPRPVYRTEVGAQPIRRNTFSLGYISHGGYGSYYY